MLALVVSHRYMVTFAEVQACFFAGNGNVLSLFKSHQSDSEIVPTAQNILKEYLDEKFSEFVINLQCGSLSSKVSAADIVYISKRWSYSNNQTGF